jgi:probable HAF family extracellular repeat protein
LSGDTGSTAFAVNNNGDAVGFSSGPAGEHAVIWRAGGAAIALQGESGTMERALAINDRGDVAGVADDSGSRTAVVWRRAGALQVLDMLPDFITSQPSGINATGDVVGYSQNLDGQRRATLWPANGGALDVGTLPGGSFSQAFGINNRGDIVGTSGSGAGNRAFVRTAGSGLQDLNSLNPPSPFILTTAVGINNAGMIIATGHDAGMSEHEEHEAPIRVFLLKPSGV